VSESSVSKPLPRPASGPISRRRRSFVVALLVLATITGLVAVLSTWVKRQALDSGNWTNTSSKLLADKHVQDALGAYLVNELFTNVDVAGQLRSALPPQGQALAGPAAAGLRELANRAAPQLLARPRVQDAWRNANAAAHRQFLAILNGGGNTVSTNNGEVTLDLHSLVDQLAATLGIQKQVNTARGKVPASALPASSGRLVIMRSSQLQTAQDVTKGIRNISIIFTAVSLALFALAVWLARGRRRLTLRGVGWCLVGIGIFALLARRVGGNEIVNGLVKADSIKPAAHDSWAIGTSLLRAISLALVIYGLVIVTAAWLAGPTRAAVAVRRALAPSLREHPARVYAAVAGVYLLVLLWGPTPALRSPIPILLIAALLVVGIELLRRQADAEFPGAREGDTMQRFRDWNDARRHRTNGQPVGVVADGGDSPERSGKP
jgi:hypothetical protein